MPISVRKAPAAKLFAVNFNNSDAFLQQQDALTNALISNNSWGYGGDFDYDSCGSQLRCGNP